jgi:hypothetical protein
VCILILFVSLSADIVDSVRLLGSYGGQVLVLVNSLLVCSLTMDTEFDRVALHDCVALEMSFDPYDDDDLPQRAGLPVSFTFQSPLLFAMTLDGVICILRIIAQCLISSLQSLHFTLLQVILLSTEILGD